MVKISEISLLSSEEDRNEISLLVDTFNQTSARFPKNQMIHELFEEQAIKFPDKIALVGEEKTFTYKELSIFSGKIASFLMDNEIEEEAIVALFLDNSIYSIAAMIGVLKSGGSYLPLSTSDPSDRLKYILNECSSKLVITEKKYIKELNNLQWECDSLKSFLCIDSHDIHSEKEELNELMKEELWDYIGKESHDDISGGAWQSSYTGEDLSREEMDEYSDNILSKLKPYLSKEMRVLEIGCASGLSMFKICSLVDRYVCTDLSSKILNDTEKEIAKRGIENITSHHLAAHDIDKLEKGNFDVIILNSVIQCFNGHNYLRDVIRKCVSLLNEKGIIFLGDIQDVDAKNDFLSSLRAFQDENENKDYKTKLDWTNELFLSKEFIDDLKYENPSITEVIHSNKIGKLKNELTEYRFDSILRVDKKEDSELQHCDRNRLQFDFSHLEKYSAKIFAKGRGGDLAYIIYTSGSTGFPKGCMVTHENVVRLIKNDKHPFDLSDRDVWIMCHPINFDFSVWEIYGSLLYGGSLMVPSRQRVKDMNALLKYIDTNKVTIFNQTPLAFRYFVDEAVNSEYGLSSLRYIIFGGDKLKFEYLRKWTDKFPLEKVKLINMYGITETTVHVSFHEVTYANLRTSESSPVGRPLPETEVYILSENKKLVPIGVIGEVCVGGTGVCKGYLNQPELTAERFINNPYKEGTLLYRSGDMGKWNADGSFEIVGRKDEQVKIRGYRIELSEIRKAMMSFASVSDVLIIQKSKQGENELVGYIIANKEIDLSLLRSFLAKKIVSYMIPAYLIQIDKIPLTNNGKLNIKELPNPFEQEKHSGKAEPRTKLEAQLHAIWQEILDVERIYVQDNFFEIGGHSLKATKLVSRIYKDLNIKIELRDVFLNASIEKLAYEISNRKRIDFEQIEKTEEKDLYKSSHAQKRIWVLSQWEERNVAYNIPECFRIEGTLEIDILQQSFDKMIERHESLRTAFMDINSEIMQRIIPYQETTFKVDVIDLSGWDNREELDSNIDKLTTDETKTVFDLSKGGLIRAKLLKIDASANILVLTMHHIITDGWSMGVFMNELTELYQGLKKGDNSPLKPLRIQYKDFSEWQNRKLEQTDDESIKEYWNQRFKGDIPVLDILTDYPRPSVKTYNGERLGVQLESTQVKAVKEYSTKEGASIFMVLLASINLLLHKYSGQEDLIVGMPVTGRDHPDLDKQIGCYINTLALRTQFSEKDNFKKLLSIVRRDVIGAFDNQQYPFDKLIDDLQLSRDMGRNPLFDVVVQYLTPEFNEIKDGAASGLHIGNHPFKFGISKFDLDFTFTEKDDNIALTIEYNVDLFTRSRIEKMLSHYQVLLSSILDHPDASLDSFTCVDENEKKQLLDKNLSTFASSTDETIVSLFEKQALESPHDVAVVCKEKKLTYLELNTAANRLARYLKSEYNVVENDRVGVFVEKSDAMIVVLIAILKAGAAYVPIDLDYLTDREVKSIEDCATKVIITSANEWPGQESARIVNLNAIKEALKEQNASNLTSVGSPNNLAYIMFTSGSTGDSKGVMVDHSCVVSLVHNQSYIHLSKSNKLLQTGALTFDATIIEIWGTLLNGGELHLLAKNELINISLLKEYIYQNGINMMWFTAPFFNAIVEEDISIFQPIKTLMVGGDRLSPVHINQVRNAYNDVSIYNLYGPTENTTFSTHYKISKEHDLNIPLGNPLPGRSVIILDSNLKPVPTMIVGEIYLGGAGLSRGYLNNPELTYDKFITTDFVEGTLYRTGDLGYIDSAGLIQYVGRKDRQLKINGFRVEPAEIDEYVKKHLSVKESHSLGIDLNEKNTLVCYYTAKEDLSASELRSFLNKKLPTHIIPSFFVQLEKIPLTPNGKVDTDKLPLPNLSNDWEASDYIPPTNHIQKNMQSMWADLLRVEKISLNDNFFDIGGNSLIATQLISRISKKWDVNIEIKDFFMNPTIEGVSEILEKSSQTTFKPIEIAEEQEYYPVTPSQRRLWGVHNIEDNPVGYNVSSSYTINGSIELNILHKVFTTLVQRHETLRTVFEFVEGTLVQRVLSMEEVNSEVEFTDLSSEADKLSKASKMAFDEGNTIFNLDKAPLFKVKLLKIEEGHHKFIFTIHHIICDAWSMEILVKEFFHLYQVFKNNSENDLPSLMVQYKDYAVWLEGLLKGDYYESARKFWKDKLTPPPAKLEFPVDSNEGAPLGAQGEESIVIPEDVHSLLKGIAKDQNTSTFMILLSSLNVLLYRYTNNEDITVGCPLAGRVHVDLEDQIGLFTNTLLYRTKVQKEDSFLHLLSNVKESVLQSFSHQLYPFDALLSEIGMEHSKMELPIEVMMQYLKVEGFESNPDQKDRNKDLNINHFIVNRSNASLVLLYFTFLEIKGKLQLSVKYDSARLNDTKVRRLVERFVSILRNGLTSLDSPVKKIEMDEEKVSDTYEKVITESFDFEF